MEKVYVRGFEHQNFTFPAGEMSVRLDPTITGTSKWPFEIVAHIQNSDDVMQVLLLNDALRRLGHKDISLWMPYVPYSRQDRVCNVGESLSIKVFADLINSCGFNLVTIFDPHSDVTPALINNVNVIDQTHIFKHVYEDWSDIVIVAPDGGALKKCEKFASDVGAKKVVAAMKKRNVSTGQLEYVKLTESVRAEHVFVLDDIIEGGGTFFLLAEQMKDVAFKELAVTHGIFSKGFGILDIFDQVYTTSSYHPDLTPDTNFRVLPA